MDFFKLIIVMITYGAPGYAMGYGGAWLLRADTPCLFGIGAGGLLVVIAMWLSSGVRGKSIVETSEKPEMVLFTYDVNAVDMSFDGSGPFLVKRKDRTRA